MARRSSWSSTTRMRLLMLCPRTPGQAKVRRSASRAGPSGSCEGRMIVGVEDANSVILRKVCFDSSGSKVTPSTRPDLRMSSE